MKESLPLFDYIHVYDTKTATKLFASLGNTECMNSSGLGEVIDIAGNWLFRELTKRNF